MAAPSRFFFCGANVIDQGIVSASSEIASLPASNLQIPSRARVWRCPSTGAVNIDVHWNGAAPEINFLTLWRHNLEPAATWRPIGYPNMDWTGTPLFDPGAAPAYDAPTLGELELDFGPLGNNGAIYLPQPRFSTYFTDQTYQPLSMRITLEDIGNSSGWLEASRWFAGNGIEFEYDPAELSLGWDDQASLTRMAGGGSSADAISPARIMRASKTWISEEIRARLFEAYRYAGGSREVFVAAFPAATAEAARDFMFPGRILSPREVAFGSGIRTTFDTNLEILES